MPFHYARLPADQGVARAEGAAPGEALTARLARGLPPERVALELFVAVCEILVIAKEDGAIHGDLGAEHVRLTADGVVALDGFGVARPTTRAPEGVPQGPVTDAFGAGRIGAALFCPDAARLDAAPGDARGLEDAVDAVVMAADLAALGAKPQNDVRWFLLNLLAFDRAQRPTVDRAWAGLAALLPLVEGPTLEAWVREAARPAAPAAPGPPVFGGPIVSAGPLAKALDFGPAAGGQRTAYWTREEAAAQRGAASRPDVDDDAPVTRPHRAPSTPADDLEGDPEQVAARSLAEPVVTPEADAGPVETVPFLPPGPVVVRGPIPRAEPADRPSLFEALSPAMVVFLGAAVTFFLLACLAVAAAVVVFLLKGSS